MFSIVNLGIKIRKVQIRNQQLHLFYPKEIYDPIARKEMKMILTQFNDLFYETYPEMLKGKRQVLLDQRPHKHTKKYEIQRDITLYKTQKVRRKELTKIQELLNFKYIAEEQIVYYTDMLQKAMLTKKQLKEGPYSEYFPQLFENRIAFIEKIEHHCLEQLELLMKDKKIYGQSIDALLHHPQSFWGDAKRLLEDIVADSVKHVTDVTGATFRKK